MGTETVWASGQLAPDPPPGVYALHVSMGSLFPHPLNPPGDFAFETITRNYDAMLSSGTYTLRNYFLFRYRFLRPIFYLIWFRMKWGKPVQGVGADAAAAIKKSVNIPVISACGWQSASLANSLGLNTSASVGQTL